MAASNPRGLLVARRAYDAQLSVALGRARLRRTVSGGPGYPDQACANICWMEEGETEVCQALSSYECAV